MLPILSRRITGLPASTDWVDREFNQLLRQFWGNGETYATAAYPVNMWEDDENIYIEAELPGFRREQVDITLEQGMLTISAERQAIRKSGDGNGTDAAPEQPGTPILHERRFTRYHRSFSLPTMVDDAKVDARLENGVLHLTLPKKAEVRPRRIKVS
jgi:HSP20 family protein